jgi:hypothetical protein
MYVSDEGIVAKSKPRRRRKGRRGTPEKSKQIERKK